MPGFVPGARPELGKHDGAGAGKWPWTPDGNARGPPGLGVHWRAALEEPATPDKGSCWHGGVWGIGPGRQQAFSRSSPSLGFRV